MTRTVVGLAALVLVPAWLGSWPLTLLAIVAALLLASWIGAWEGSGAALPPRQAHRARRGRLRLGIGLGVPVGPFLAFVTLFRGRRP